MKLFRLVMPAFLISPFYLMAQLQTTQLDNVSFSTMLNGLYTLEMPLPSTPRVEITVYIKTGSMYESDSLNGMAKVIEEMIAAKLNAYLNNPYNTRLTPANTAFNCQSTTEHAIFKISTYPANIGPCLQLIHDSIFKAKFDEPEMDTAINKVLQQIEDSKHDPRKVFEMKLMDNLYAQDHDRLNICGNPELLELFTLKEAKEFFTKYYVPNNSLLTITGPIVDEDVQQQVEDRLSGLVNNEFNPETITKINGLRPIAYTTQFVVQDTTPNPELQICWQFPGMLANRQASYSAFILAYMLSDKNNFIQVKAAKMGCRKFEVKYDVNNFNGILRIILQPSKKNFFSTYQLVLTEMSRLNETLLNDDMINAAKLEFRSKYQALKMTKEFPAWIVKAWAFNNETYFPELVDSVFDVNRATLRNFIIDYIDQAAHVTGLLVNRNDRQEMKIDSLFPELDPGVKKYVFTYRPNITDLEGADNKMMEQNLLQWLLINKDVSAQVNGFSDEHEYNRVYDDSIIQFIDSMPTFHRSTPNILKRDYLKPATMRAMKIIKYLYDHGIEADRLSGTGMMFKSSNKDERKDNMKCTLTLNKYLKSPSLFEYHYGKLKQQ